MSIPIIDKSMYKLVERPDCYNSRLSDKWKTLYRIYIRELNRVPNYKSVYLIYARLLVYTTLTYSKDYMYYILLTCGITLLF